MIYEYSCCVEFEEVVSYKERNNVKCPECGKLAKKLISTGTAILNAALRDNSGERIWFPKDGKPYFDKALRRTFKSAKEKQKHMKDNKIVMHGFDGPKKYPIESGQMRDKSYRKANRLED